MKILIGVIGSGETAGAEEIRLAEELGEAIAREGWGVLTGGRPAGVMEAALRGAKRVAGSLTVGVLPYAEGDVAADAGVAIFTGIGEARNFINVASSRVVIACGRFGAGTASEVALAVKLGRPVVLMNPAPEAETFFRSIAPGIEVARSAEEAIRICRTLLNGGERDPARR